MSSTVGTGIGIRPFRVDIADEALEDLRRRIGLPSDRPVSARLRDDALSLYLSLDWTWLSRRCAELGSVGCATLIQPHSRLLSTAGVNAALRFAGTMAATGAAETR
jgi:hypothetical protein